MKSYSDFIWVKFNGNAFAKPLYEGDVKPSSELKQCILEQSYHLKPVCVVVSYETYMKFACTFTAERSECGILLQNYNLPFNDTRIACEEYLSDYKATRDVVRKLEEEFETVYDH